MPIFQNPEVQSPDEYVAGRFLQESASRSAGAYVAQAVSGQNPDTYDEGWANIADQFRQQFPNINPERAQEIYQIARRQSAREGMTFTPQGGRESSERTIAGRIPIFGGGIQAEQNRRDTESLTRIREGTATHEDYAQYREMASHNEAVANRSNLRAAGETIAGSIAFGADFAAVNLMTGGFGSAAIVARGTGAMARTAQAAQAAVRGIGVAAAMPGRAMEAISRHEIPDVARDEQGNLHIGGNKTWGDSFQGYLDHQIEVWSEMSGEALLHGLLHGGSAVLNRLPGGIRAQAVASGLMARVATNPRLRAALNQAGFSNMLSEFLEERAGEIARGATGVSNDFGMTGDVAAGRYRQALNQLAVEGLAFGGMQVGITGASMALNRVNQSPGTVAMQALRRVGFSEIAARTQVMTAAESIADGTAAPVDVRPGPLRTLAEAVQERVKDAEKAPTATEAAVEQAQSGTVPRITPAAEGTQQPGFMRQSVLQQTDQNIPNSSETPNSSPTGQNLTSSPANLAARATSESAPAAPQPAQNPRGGQSITQTAPDALARPPGPPSGVVPSAAQVTKASISGKVSKEAASFEHDALKMLATSQNVSPAGGKVAIRKRLERTPAGKAALAGLPKMQETLRQVAQMNLVEGKTPVPEPFVKALATSSMHPSERSSLEGVLSGIAERPLSKMRDEKGKPVITNREEPGKGVSHETVRKYAEQGFQTLKKEQPGKWDEYPLLADYLLEQHTEHADAMAQQMGGEPITPDAMEEIEARDEAIVEERKKLEEDRTLYQDLTRKGKASGRTEIRISQDAEAASAEEVANYRRKRGSGQAASAQGKVPGPTERLSASRAGAAEPARTAPITPVDLKAVADLSPHHAALIGKAQKLIIASQLPIGHKMAYLRAQVEVLGRMQVAHAELASQNLKDAKFFETAKELTASIKDSPAARAALAAGQYAGGSFNDTTGIMRLDGATSKESVARTAGHEYSHVGEGKETAITKTPGWQNAWKKELADGQLTDYAKHDVDEGLAEIMGEILSGDMSTEALWQRFPLVAAELEGHGWIPERSGDSTFNKPADIFDYPINDGPLHADILLKERLHVSQEDVKASAKVAMTWAGKIKERVLDYMHNNIRPAVRLEAAARKAGYSPGVGMNVVNVLERLQFGDKRYADDMRTNGMATLANGHWARTGLPWEQVIAPLTEEDKSPVDGRKSAWQKTKDWFQGAETEPVSKFDLFATARHVVDEASRGKFVVPEAEVANFQAVLDEFSADPNFVQRATAVHDALTQHVYNASLDARSSPDVHNLTKEQVERFKKAHPTYIETTRIMDDEAFFPEPVAGVKQSRDLGRPMEREGHSSRSIVPPLVTAYNRYQKTASLVLEQIRRNAMADIFRMNLPGWAEAGDIQTKFEIEKDGLKAVQVMRKLNMSQEEVDKFLEQLEALGATAQAYFIQKPWSDKTPNLFWWKDENGNLTNFKILDRSLYELATGQQGNGNAVIEMLRAAGNIGFNTPAGRFKLLPAMTQLVKTGATTASAAFQVNNTLNPMRDPLTFLSNTIDQTTATELPAMIFRVYQAEINALRGKTDDVLFQYYKQSGGEATKMFPAADIPNMGSTKIEYIKQLVKAAQAGELAPRFLEFRTRLRQLGWSEERIIEEAAKAHAEGGNYRDPVPFGVRLEAETAASEVTGPFARGGILTRELNQVVPFFQPSIAVLGKQISNWRTNAKGAAIAMGIYLGFKLAHFLRYKDEDWYKELNGYDRFNNFVVMTPIGLRRIAGARGFEVPIGGTLTSILERMYGQRPDLIGLLEQTHGAISPPAPIPPIGSTAWELHGNQDWLGRPIVPGRDERLSGWDKATQYQVPYALRALTGGRAEISLRGAGLTVAAQVRPHRSVDELFSQFAHLETARAQALRQGQPFALESEYRRFSQATTAIRNLSRTLRGEAMANGRVVKISEPDQDQQDELRRRQADVARRTMGWSI